MMRDLLLLPSLLARQAHSPKLKKPGKDTHPLHDAAVLPHPAFE